MKKDALVIYVKYLCKKKKHEKEKKIFARC